MHRTLSLALLFVVAMSAVASAQETDHLAELEALIKETNEAAEQGAKIQRPARHFAGRQLAQLLEDRPSMQGIVPEGHPIREWVLIKFSTGDSGRRVYWDHQQPFSGSEAENQPGQESYLACVRITADKEVSGRDKWYMLVFEMENMQNARKFEVLTSMVADDQIDREHFIEYCINLEFEADTRAKELFKKTPLPGVTPENAPQYVHRMAEDHDLPRYMEFLETLGPDRYNPLEYFGDYYDQWATYWESQRVGEEQEDDVIEVVQIEEEPIYEQEVQEVVSPPKNSRTITIEGGTTTIKDKRIVIEGGKTVIAE